MKYNLSLVTVYKVDLIKVLSTTANLNFLYF